MIVATQNAHTEGYYDISSICISILCIVYTMVDFFLLLLVCLFSGVQELLTAFATMLPISRGLHRTLEPHPPLWDG